MVRCRISSGKKRQIEGVKGGKWEAMIRMMKEKGEPEGIGVGEKSEYGKNWRWVCWLHETTEER